MGSRSWAEVGQLKGQEPLTKGGSILISSSPRGLYKMEVSAR